MSCLSTVESFEVDGHTCAVHSGTVVLYENDGFIAVGSIDKVSPKWFDYFIAGVRGGGGRNATEAARACLKAYLRGLE